MRIRILVVRVQQLLPVSHILLFHYLLAIAAFHHSVESVHFEFFEFIGHVVLREQRCRPFPHIPARGYLVYHEV